jgi:hypothetical protein
MAATSITTPGEALPGIPIGARLRAELERRVRELECRFKPCPRDMRELAQLREFLKVTPTASETVETVQHLGRL